MTKLNFTFIRNRFYLAGLFTGIMISALAGILLVSSHCLSPDSSKVKGSIIWMPSLNDVGTVVSAGIDCGNQAYGNVQFDSDPGNTIVKCHTDGSYGPSSRVQITGFGNGSFCNGGGPFVTNAIQN